MAEVVPDVSLAMNNARRYLSCAAQLRREIIERSRQYAHSLGLTPKLSYGELPTVMFEPDPDRQCHGNFCDASYKEILRSPEWSRRLTKVHAQERSLPRNENGRWRELDSCNSSDALLMNIFCYPRVLKRGRLCGLLGVETGMVAEFGVRARVPLAEGKFDRTEVDLRLGSLLIEAKLTENDFQCRAKAIVHDYRDFDLVFDRIRLPQTEHEYVGYQLIRNVLAAQATDSSFCVLCDARRPDLIQRWFDVMQCVQPLDLRLRCKVLTWQELAATLPAKLQSFLKLKYGIVACPSR